MRRSETIEGAVLAVRVVHDKTGLPPRTFVTALQTSDKAEVAATRGVSQLR